MYFERLVQHVSGNRGLWGVCLGDLQRWKWSGEGAVPAASERSTVLCWGGGTVLPSRELWFPSLAYQQRYIHQYQPTIPRTFSFESRVPVLTFFFLLSDSVETK